MRNRSVQLIVGYSKDGENSRIPQTSELIQKLVEFESRVQEFKILIRILLTRVQSVGDQILIHKHHSIHESLHF